MAAVLLAFPTEAQVAAPWLLISGPESGYLEVPHDPSLNPASEITVEAWVHFADATGTGDSSCPSIVGKSYPDAYWLGMCSQHLRFYPRGSSSSGDSTGVVPLSRWVHVAATYDGATTRFYIDGMLDSEVTLSAPGPPTPSEAPLRIGSDPSWDFSPLGALDEVRLWGVARTEAEIQATMHTALNSAQPGLISVWHLDGDGEDAIAGNDGALSGTASFGGSTLLDCTFHTAVAAGGHLPGEGGSQWVTDLVLFNQSEDGASATVFLLPRGSDNTEALSAEIPVAAGRSVVLRDVVLTTFGRSNMAAAFRICSDRPLMVQSRTFNDSDEGTFGQGIPGRAASQAAGPGDVVHLAGLGESARTRTNVGFTNLSPTAAEVAAEMHDDDGALLGSRSYSIPPYGHLQRNRIFTEVTGGPVTNGVVKIRVESGLVLVYGSMVDAQTNDPTFFLAE